MIADQEASGLPVSVFCRERGIPQASHFAWRRRLSRAETSSTPAKFQVVKLVPETSGQSERFTDGSIELFLRGGSGGERRLLIQKGFDRGLLLDLVQALESLA